MPEDRMGRDIRDSVKKAVKVTGRYGVGVGKLFLASGKEFFNAQMPAVQASFETNKELLDDTVKFLRNPVDSINKRVDRAMQTEGFKELEKFAKNALDDLKTGNLYDPNRDRSDIGMQIDDMLSNFGGFDMDGFDENGDWSEGDFDSSGLEGEAKIAEIQEQNADKRTTATIDAIGASTNAIVANNTANHQRSLKMDLKYHTQQMNMLQNMITSQNSTFELMNQSVKASLEVTREAHNQMMTEMGDIKNLLSQIVTNTTPAKPEKEQYREREQVFGSNGEVNIKQYLKKVMKNADEYFGIGSAVNMATGGLDMKTMIQMVSDNPWQLVTDMLLRKMIPEKTKKQMENTNKNLASFFPALFQKFGQRGKKFENGDGTFADMVLGLLGVRQPSRTSIDTEYKNPLEVAAFTSKTTRAIEEVIPMWLSKIYSAVSGEPMSVYNYTTGKLESANKIITSSRREAKDLVDRMGDGARTVKEYAHYFDFKNSKQQEEFDQYIYNYLQKMAEGNEFINPRDKDFEKNLPSHINGTQYGAFLKAILTKMPQDKLMSLSREITEARLSRDKNNLTLNQKLKESGTIAAYSFSDSDLISRLETASDGSRTSLSETEISNLSREYQASIRNKTGRAATNVLLNDILGTMKKGLLVYSYNIGTANNTDDVSEVFRLIKQTAVDQSAAEAKVKAAIAEESIRESERLRREEEAWKERRNKVDLKPEEYGVLDNWDYNDAASFLDSAIINKTSPGDSNNPEVEKQRKLQEQQKGRRDAVMARIQPMLDDVTGKVGAAAQKGGITQIFAYMKQIAQEPFKLFNTGMQIADAFMFKVLFGNDPAASIDLDSSEPYLLQVLTKSLKTHFSNFTSWMSEHIGGPIKKYLFDKEEGLFPRIGSAVAEVLGINKLKDKVKTKTTELKEKADKKLRGTKDEETGRWSGGILSDTLNKFKDVDSNAKNMTKNALTELLYGKDAATAQDKGKRKVYDQDDKYHYEYGGIIGSVRKGFDSFKEMMFGPEDEEPDSKKKFKKVTSELHKAFPDMAVGAGVGALTSLFLPGGPVIGAVIGSTAGLVKGSDGLKSFLFGEFGDEDELVVDKDGKPITDPKTGKPKTRKKQTKTGLIDREIGDGLKKYLPAGAKGGALGIVGSMFLPGGSLLGGVIGSMVGMASASDKLKEVIFGNVEDSSTGLISKDFRDKVTKQVKKYAPFTIGGGALGGLLGSGLGLIPGLSLLPTGPIFAIMGSLMGFANSDKLEKFFFGEEVEQQVESTDSKGNKITTTQRVRKGGVFGDIHDFVRDKLLTPFGKKVNEVGHKISGWFEDSIIAPLQRSTEGFHKKISEAGSQIKESLTNIGQKITDGITGVFEKAFGVGKDEEGHERKGLRQLFEDKLFKPLENMMDRMLTAIGSIIGKVIAAPFKAFEYIMTGGPDEDDLKEDGYWSKKEERRKKRADKKHERHMAKAGNLFKKAGEKFKSAFAFGMDPDGKLNDVNSMGGTIDPNNPNATVGGSLRYKQNSAGRWYDTQTGRLVSQQVVYDAGQIDYLDAQYKVIQDDKKSSKGKSKKTSSSTSETDTSSKKSKSTKTKSSDEKSDKMTDEEVNRTRNKGRLRTKTNNEYLRDIAKYTKKTYEELRGQVNGVGWNTAYIMTLLQKQYGGLDDSELPEEMEGSKRKIRKRRTIFGRAKDKITDFFGNAKDKVVEKIEKAKDGIGKVLQIIIHPFKLIGEVVSKAGQAIKAFGGALWEGVKTIGSALGEILKGIAKGLAGVLEGAGKLIAGAAKGIGETLGNLAAGITGALKDLTLGITAGVRGLFEIAADIAPDIAHVAWKGVTGATKLAWKGTKFVAKKAAKGLSWVFNKITGRGGDKDSSESGGVRKKIKEIGTFRVEGGYLDNVNESIIRLGDPLAPIKFPLVTVLKGKSATKEKHAIPVFIMGADSSATLKVRDKSKTEDMNETEELKKAYKKADKATEKVDDPRDAYDRSISQAKTSTDIEATELVNQLNGGSGNSGNGKGSGDDDDSNKSNFWEKIKNLFGKGGTISKILTGLATTALPIAWHFTSDSGNKSEGVKQILNTVLKKTGLKKSKLSDIASAFTGSSTATKMASEVVENAAESGSKKAVKNASKTARTYKVFGKIGDFASAIKDGIGYAKDPAAAAAAEVAQEATDSRWIKANASAWGKIGDTARSVKSKVTGTKVVSKAADLAANAKTAIKQVIDKFFSNSTVKKAFGKLASKMGPVKNKLIKELSDNVLTQALKRVGKTTAAATAKLAAAVGTGGLLAIGFAIWDFMSGLNNAKKYFDVFSDEVTLGMRLTSGICECLGGLLSYIPVVGGPLSIVVSLLMGKIVQLIYKVFADDEAEAELKADQEALKNECDAYNAEHGTDYTVDEFTSEFYSDGTKKTWYRDIWRGTKKVASSVGNTVKNWWNKLTGKSSDSDESGKGRAANYSQTDPRWNTGNMASTGCGPTSAAIVDSYYGGNSNPKMADIASKAMGMRAADGGTNPNFFAQYANGKNYSMQRGPVNGGMIANSLNAGNPVILMGKGGEYGSNMHYMVADGMNGKGKINLIDPASGASKSSSISSVIGNTRESIYSYGKGKAEPTLVQDSSTSNGNAAAQAALVNILDGITGQLAYSTDGNKQDPDKGVASCASTVAWAYNKVLGIRPGDSVSKSAYMKSTKQAQDNRFSTIYENTGNALVDTSILQPGDIMYMNWDRTSNNDQMQHTEMYAGNGQTLSHGGNPAMGPAYKTLNNYRMTHLMKVRRYNPFIDGSSVTYEDVTPTVDTWTGKTTTNTKKITESNGSGFNSGNGLDVLNELESMFTNVGSLFGNILDKLLGQSSTDEEGNETSLSLADGSTSSSSGSFNNGTNIGGGRSSITSYTPTNISSMTLTGNSGIEQTWNFLRSKGLSKEATAGIMGNLNAESGFKFNNLQNSYERTLGFSDDSYTKAVDDGSYSNFVNDSAGYGLAQWTYSSRKKALYDLAKSNNASIADPKIQLSNLYRELNDYGLISKLGDGVSVSDASKIILQQFEKPESMNETSTINKRAGYSQEIYDKFKNEEGTTGMGPGVDSSWGKGPTSNLSNLNDRVNRINNTITKIQSEAAEGSTVAQVTNAITKAVTDSSNSGNNNTEDMLNVLTKSLATMIDLLSAIKDNTASNDDVRTMSSEDDSMPTVKANDIIRSNATDNPNNNNSGAKIMDLLTSK